MASDKYPRHWVTDGAVFLNISSPSPNGIIVDVLWVDRYCPEQIEMLGVGLVAIPKHISNQKTSLIVLDQRLEVLGDPSD